MKNLALGKRCSQSSTFGEVCGKSVDGNLETYAHTKHAGYWGGSNYGEGYPWWYVDLGNTYKVKRVDIYNRLNSGK